jgi:hypothetical protein
VHDTVSEISADSLKTNCGITIPVDIIIYNEYEDQPIALPHISNLTRNCRLGSSISMRSAALSSSFHGFPNLFLISQTSSITEFLTASNLVLKNRAEGVERKPSKLVSFLPQAARFDVLGGKGLARWYFELMAVRNKWLWGIVVAVVAWYVAKKAGNRR